MGRISPLATGFFDRFRAFPEAVIIERTPFSVQEVRIAVSDLGGSTCAF